jgi:OMF family outer membrane factor
MLVNIHKLILILIMLQVSGRNLVHAQEPWSLKQCLDTAQAYNRGLRIERNNIAISGQKEKEVKASLYPKITANADYKYFMDLPYQLMPMSTFNPSAPAGQFKEAQFGVPHSINANLQLVLPLYNPQLNGAIQNSKVASELSQLQYQKSQEQVFYEITNLYYNAQILYHQLAFLDSNLLNTGKLLKNMQLLREQLLAKGTDVNKVMLQAEQLSTQKENVRSKYLQVMNVLKLNMGIPLERDIEIETEIHFRSAEKYIPVPTPDMRIIQTQNKLLTNELNILNKSKNLPILNFIASYGTTGFGYDKKPNTFLKFFPVGFAGIQISYPLFNGTVTQRKLAQKKIEIDNNVLQSEMLTEQNKIQVENATRQRVVAGKTVTNTRDQIVLAQNIYEQTILQQKQGTASLTDVLLADTALREAQQNYLTAVIDYLKADMELMKLTGNIPLNK